MKFRILIPMVVMLFAHVRVVGQSVVINEFMSSNDTTLYDEDGDASDWIELYNNTSQVIPLEGFSISDGNEEWIFPQVDLIPNDFLMLFASAKNRNSGEIHLNFKISSSGETLTLRNASQSVIDELDPVPVVTDHSYGRANDGSEVLGEFFTATPGTSNNGNEQLIAISASSPTGVYPQEFQITLSGSDSIYYTLDGSSPTVSSILYSGQISIEEYPDVDHLAQIPTTYLMRGNNSWPEREFGWAPPSVNMKGWTVVRAQPFKNGAPSGKVYTFNYFVGQNIHTVPTLLLDMDTTGLFSYGMGIYIPGENWDQNNDQWTGNYYMKGEDWERKCNVSYIDVHGIFQSAQDLGVRIHGGKSRSAPQKSLRFYARPEFDGGNVRLPILQEREGDLKRFILRTPYSYWYGNNTMFQDDLLQELIKGSDLELDVQFSEPTVVYLNGAYWGVHSIKERQDQYYFKQVHDIDPERLDLLRSPTQAIHGSAEDVTDLVEFIEMNDLSFQANYDLIKERINVLNFTDHMLTQMFLGNEDWPLNNIKMWRDRTEDPRWSWLLYDLDATLNNPAADHVERFINGQHFYADLLKSLLKNDDYRVLFSERVEYIVTDVFSRQNVQQKINYFVSLYDQEVPHHIGRWGNPLGIGHWNESVSAIQEFLNERPCPFKEMIFRNLGGDLVGFNCSDDDGPVIRTFPNPTNGLVTVSFESDDVYQGNVILIGPIGTEISRTTLKNNRASFDLSEHAAGVYLIRIDGSQDALVRKVIRN